MGKMFVANCTNQAQEFIYRIPGIAAPRVQRIEIGRQVQLSGDLDPKQVESIVDQHEKYGLINVTDIDRRRPFAGLCWSDKAISVEKVKKLWMNNQSQLTKTGQEHRAAAAVAANNALEEQAPGALKSLEMSVEEAPTDKNPDPTFEEQVRVTPDASETDGKGFVQGNKPGNGNKNKK